MTERLPRSRILVVDDDDDMRTTCRDLLQAPEQEVSEARNAEEAREALRRRSFDLLLVDLRLGADNGLDVLSFAREVAPEQVVILFTGYPTVETAVEGMRNGAFDYVCKPFTSEQLRLATDRALAHASLLAENRFYRGRVEGAPGIDRVLGESAVMKTLFEHVRKSARGDAGVLLAGETGTGKGLLARTIHDLSARTAAHFVPLDCGALPEHLLEAELFGHEKGAFTGAHVERAGLLEFAHGGTFFLDEVCELPVSLQSKLLGVLQDREFRRIGGNQRIPTDVRIVAATNRNIDAEVAAGRFRMDLFYRLNVLRLHVPPLRDRRGDVPLLAQAFLTQSNARQGRDVKGFSPEALARLESHTWPGNVRELQNAVEHAVAMTSESWIGIDVLPAAVLGGTPSPIAASYAESRAREMEQFDHAYFHRLLAETQGEVAAALDHSGLSRATLYRYLNRVHLRPSDFRRD